MCKLYNSKMLALALDKKNSQALFSHISSCLDCQEALSENEVILDAYKGTLKHVPSLRRIKTAVIKDSIRKSVTTITSVAVVILLSLAALPLGNPQVLIQDHYTLSAKSDNYMDIKLYELEDKVAKLAESQNESFMDREISNIELKIIDLKSTDIF